MSKEDILRRARILNYDRFYTPNALMLADPTFVYEYVQTAVHKKLDNGCSIIIWQHWKKAQKGTAYDPCIDNKEIIRKMQHNELRAKKEIKTIELRKILEEERLPLQFFLPDGITVIVLPKNNGHQNEVYVQWNQMKNLFVEQYSIYFKDTRYKAWFNSERANSEIGEDWRCLLKLNNMNTGRNILYKYFEGIYTGNIEELKEGTKKYKELLYPKSKKAVTKEAKARITKRIEEQRKKYVEEQKQICIKNPTTGKIIRMQKFKTGKFIKKGWTYASKEDYKAQQRLSFQKRKDMAEDNLQEQMQKYKGPRIPDKPRGIPGSPFYRYQTIAVWPTDKEGNKLEEETFKVRVIIPIFEYIPQYFKGKQLLYYKAVKVGEEIEYHTYTIKAKPIYKTIKVLQIPSKLSISLKALSEPSIKVTDGIPVFRIVRDYSIRYARDKKWRARFSEWKKGDPRNK